MHMNSRPSMIPTIDAIYLNYGNVLFSVDSLSNYSHEQYPINDTDDTERDYGRDGGDKPWDECNYNQHIPHLHLSYHLTNTTQLHLVHILDNIIEITALDVSACHSFHLKRLNFVFCIYRHWIAPAISSTTTLGDFTFWLDLSQVSSLRSKYPLRPSSAQLTWLK